MATTLSPLPSWVSSDERMVDREPVAIKTTFSNRKVGVCDARVTDLNPLGCRIEVDVRLIVGSLVTVGLTAAIEATGWVAWVAGGAAGIEFAHRVPEAVIAAIVQQRPSGGYLRSPALP